MPNDLRVVMLAAATVAGLLISWRLALAVTQREPEWLVTGYYWSLLAWLTMVGAAWVTLLLRDGG